MIKMFPEEKQKIIFANHKRKIGIGYTIYANSKIIGYTPSITNKGIRIPSEIGKYFVFPKTQKEHFKIKVTYEFQTDLEPLEFLNVDSEIYMEKIAYPNRKKRKIAREVVFIKPIQKKILQQIRNSIKKHKRIHYTINKQLAHKDYFLKMQKIRNNSLLDFDLVGMTLITTGGLQKAQFEIYRNKANQLFVKTQTSVRKWGKVTLSSHLRNHIIDFFNYSEIICKSDNNDPMIISTYQRLIGNRTLFEIRLPYFLDKKREATIIFTHPNFSLTETTINDYKITCQLQDMGFPIKSFYSLFFNGNHTDYFIEKKMRSLIEKAFSNKQYKIFSDVQINFDSCSENNLGNKHAFDNFIIDTKDNSLVLVEYKTSFSSTKHSEIDSAIAEMHHYRRKLGNNVFIIIIINDDLLSGSKTISKKFGLANDLLLIGKEEFDYLFDKPDSLLNQLKQFKKTTKTSRKETFLKETSLFSSIDSELNLENEVLKKNRELVLNKIPGDFRFNSNFTVSNNGGDFEKEVQLIFEKKGYDVVSNLLIGYYNRKMEIDLICFKNEKITLISCRNAVNIKCQMSLKLDLKQKACKIEYRKFILNADEAKLYVKVTPETYQNVKDFEGLWIENVEIVFIVNNKTYLIY